MIEAAWRGGLPLLADNGGAALAGRFFAAQAPTPADVAAAEIAIQGAFIQDTTIISNGLNLLNVMIEPQVLSDNRWGRLFSLGLQSPRRDRAWFNQRHRVGTHGRGRARDWRQRYFCALICARPNVRWARVINSSSPTACSMCSRRATRSSPSRPIRKRWPVRIATPLIPTITPTPTATPPPPTLAPTATRRPPTATATATPTLEPPPPPTPVPVNVTSTPVFPFALGLGGVILLIVLLAARRPVARDE